MVVAATGRFTQGDAGADHLKAGARKVLITAPARDADLTVVDDLDLDAGEARALELDAARLDGGGERFRVSPTRPGHPFCLSL